MARTYPKVEVEDIPGNAANEIKELVAWSLSIYMGHDGRAFADAVGRLVRITEVSIVPKAEEESRVEGRVVCEIIVTEEMTNGGGKIHGACSAYLVDICSSLPIAALSAHQGGSGDGGVSQSLNMIYHAPAEVGTPLRVVSTSMTLGNRAMSARCEIWDTEHRRLVASGTHIKMLASFPRDPDRASAKL